MIIKPFYSTRFIPILFNCRLSQHLLVHKIAQSNGSITNKKKKKTTRKTTQTKQHQTFTKSNQKHKTLTKEHILFIGRIELFLSPYGTVLVEKSNFKPQFLFVLFFSHESVFQRTTYSITISCLRVF